MAFIGGLLSGSKGSNFQAQSAPILNPTNAGQINQQYGNAQDALKQQNDFLAALKGQNGIANQSGVYNQLSGIASGQGPNPAQTMLAQATGQNVAQTGALMGSARGVSQNPGMMARQAGQAGANIQQNAVGQGATMQAQQSLGALNQMGQIAGQQVANQAGATGALNQYAQGEQGQILGAAQGQNSSNIQNASQQNQANAAIAAENAKNQASGIGGLLNAAGTAIGLAQGGEVAPGGPRSHIGQLMLSKGGKVPARVSPGEIYLPPTKARAVASGKASPAAGEKIKGKAKVKGDSYSNDTVKKTLKEGGVVVPRSIAGDLEKSAAFVRAVMGKGRHA